MMIPLAGKLAILTGGAIAAVGGFLLIQKVTAPAALPSGSPIPSTTTTKQAASPSGSTTIAPSSGSSSNDEFLDVTESSDGVLPGVNSSASSTDNSPGLASQLASDLGDAILAVNPVTAPIEILAALW